MQRIQEFPLRVKSRPSTLPAAEQPSGRQDLKGHNGAVFRVIALPESGLIATVCYTAAEGASSALRVFGLDGKPPHTLDFPSGGGLFSLSVCGLAAVGDYVVACGGKDGMLMTCRTSTGECLDTLQLESRSNVTAMAAVGDGVFVAGCRDGTLFSLAHIGGSNLRVVAQYKSAHTDRILDIAARGEVVVTASGDKTAAVWSAATYERVAVLRGHGDGVNCAAITERFIATGSSDNSIRLYESERSFSLVRVLEGLHTYPVWHVEFVGDDLLMSASSDGSLAFTSVSTGKPMARVDVGFWIYSVAILAAGRLVCVGLGSNPVLLSPPALVAEEVKRRAATLFPCPLDLSIAENELLQSAVIEVCAGRLSAGEACRKLVTKENCSLSVGEWWSAHRLLMAAVESGEIVGELHFEGELNYWFENLYTPSRHLPLGNEDWKIIKQCANEALAAGVLEGSEAVLASVLGGQDLLREVSRLETVGQSMLFLLSKVLVRQAAADEEMQMLGRELKRQAHNQKINALLAAVFSFAPLGGAAADNAIGAVAEALPLLESMLSTGVALQGAATPALLDRFVFRANSMISAEGWARVTPENQVAFKMAVDALGIPWEVFCSMVQNAADARRDGKTDEAGEGSGEGPSGELITLLEGASSGEGSGASTLQSGDGDGGARGCHDSRDSSSASGMTRHEDKASGQLEAQLDNGSLDGTDLEVARTGQSSVNSALAIGLTLSGLQLCDGESLSTLEDTASNAKAVRLMKGEALSRTVAGVMINFDAGLRSAWLVLVECLLVIFVKEIISGDMVVGYPEVELYDRIVHGLQRDETYRKLGDSATSSFEWRLQQFLRGLRLV